MDYTLYGFNRTAFLICKYTGSDKTEPVQWWRNGKQIDEDTRADSNSDRLKYDIDTVNSSLTIILVGKEQLKAILCCINICDSFSSYNSYPFI